MEEQAKNKGGRPRGVKDPPTQFQRDVLAICQQENIDPVRGICRLSQRKGIEPHIELECYKTLMKYIYPQKRSVLVGADEDTKLVIEHRYPKKAEAEGDAS